MSFTKQTEGVPLPLVQQGWRLRATRETDKAWRAISLAHRWNYRQIQQTDGNYLELAQPVIEAAEGIRVYAHQGWGDGLAPSPEMVKVWPHWWALRSDDVLYPATVFTLGNVVLDVHADHLYPLKEWRGPVLPPVMP